MGKKAFRIVELGTGETARACAFFSYETGSDDALALTKGMTQGMWRVFLAVGPDDTEIGGFYLNFEPKYGLYRRLKLPELQDLQVHPDWRGQGIGTALVQAGEQAARDVDAPGLGISVGVGGEFGAAQRLYAQAGYIPDGHGITYDREYVQSGEKRPVDANLALMLLKFF